LLPCSTASFSSIAACAVVRGKPVEDIAALAVRASRALVHDADDEIVETSLPAACMARTSAASGVSALQAAKHVARRNLRQTETLLQQTRLRPLARARRAH
jgi:hypothetical protein